MAEIAEDKKGFSIMFMETLSLSLCPRPLSLSLSLSYMLDVSDKANAAYDGAYSIAKEHLDALHPVLLGLALNYSVFHYEIEGDVTKAIELAKQV